MKNGMVSIVGMPVHSRRGDTIGKRTLTMAYNKWAGIDAEKRFTRYDKNLWNENTGKYGKRRRYMLRTHGATGAQVLVEVLLRRIRRPRPHPPAAVAA